jgi:hypothetical protein
MNPVNENVFVHESVHSKKIKQTDVSSLIDISFICEFFHIADACRITPFLYDQLVRPYESRKKKIITDIVFDYETAKRNLVNNPKFKVKQEVFKGMYFNANNSISFSYAPWNYLDRCPLPKIKISALAAYNKTAQGGSRRHVIFFGKDEPLCSWAFPMGL